MHWLLKIRDGLLWRDSDTELKGSPVVAAGNAAVTAAEERVSVRGLETEAAKLHAVNFLRKFQSRSVLAKVRGHYYRKCLRNLSRLCNEFKK